MKKKKFTIERVIIILIVLFWIITAVLLLMNSKKKVKETESLYAAQISAVQQQLASNVKYAYLASKQIAIGETIDDTNVEYRQIISDLDQSYYIDQSAFGKVAIAPISVGTPITAGLVEEASELGVREVECSYIRLNSNLLENDFVDIRILYPNGEDYTVVSKAQLKNLNLLASNVFLWLEEDELLSIDAAVVDAALHGGKIYTTKYVKPTLQEASIVNYQPNDAVIALMRNDPNIVQRSIAYLSKEIRSKLEERLTEWESDENNEITDMTNPVVDTTVITSGSDSVDADGNYTGSIPGDSDGIGFTQDGIGELVPEEDPEVYE